MFYDNFISLCAKNGVLPSKVALDIGLTKPAVTRWKKGAVPTDASLHKVAAYFGVSVGELLGEQKEKAPSGGSLSEDEQKVLSIFEALPEDKKRDLLRIAEALLPPEAKS